MPFEYLEKLNEDLDENRNHKWILSSLSKNDIFNKLDTNNKFARYFNINRRVIFLNFDFIKNFIIDSFLQG